VQSDPALLGAIANTNSPRRLDLLVYDDGIVGVPGSYLGTVALGAGAGVGAGMGSPIAAGTGAASGIAGAGSVDGRRIARALAMPRTELLRRDGVEFIAETSVQSALLTKRWQGAWLTLDLDSSEPRTFRWKPVMNRFEVVDATLRELFGSRLRTSWGSKWWISVRERFRL
jgi:hypothetical protein